jgi:hypothetical protein
MGKTAFYRTIKGKSGKNYISVTLPTSDAAGREGGASVILEMTGEMTPEMESALLDLNVNSYKESEESNIVRKDELGRFKADVVGILSGKQPPQKVASPETETQKKDDNKDTQGVSGQGRIGQEPVQAEPEQRGGRETAPASGVLQTPEQKEGVVGEAAKTEPEKVASPKRRESVKAKQIRLAREKIKTEQDKQEQLIRIREEKKRIAEERKLAAQQVKDKTAKLKKLRVKVPASAYEGVIQFLANGGKVKESEFAQETGWDKQKDKGEFKIRKGMLDEKAAPLDDAAMTIAENMLVPEEVYDEVQIEIYTELKEALRTIRNQTQASEELLKINQDREAQYEKEMEGLEEYERSLMEAPPLEEIYTEDELKEMADAISALEAYELEREFGPASKVPTPKSKRDQLLSDIAKIKAEIRDMSKGRLSSLPVDVFAKYVELATRYVQLGVIDAYKFLDDIRSHYEATFGEVTPEVEKQLLSAHDEAMAKLKPSKFATAVSEARRGISAETKAQFAEKGAMYIPKSIKETVNDAGATWEALLEEHNGDIDKALEHGHYIVSQSNWGANPEVIGVLAIVLAKTMNEQREQPGLSIEQIQKYDSMATDMFMAVRERQTTAGREISIVGRFTRDYFMSYPKGIVNFVYTSIDGMNDAYIGTPGISFTQSVTELVNQLAQTEEGKNAIAAFASTQTRKKREYAKREKAISDFFDSFINGVDNFTKGVSFSTIVPPSVLKSALTAMKKGALSGLKIAQTVEMAIAKVKDEMQGIDFDENKARAWFTSVAEKADTYALEQTDPEKFQEMLNKKLQDEFEAKKARAKEALKKYEEKQKEYEAEAFKKQTEAEEKKRLTKERNDALRESNKQARELAQFEAALDRLSGDKLKAFAYKTAVNFINGKGSLTQSDINRAFQQALGGIQLSASQQAKLGQMATTFVNAMKLTNQASPTSTKQFIQTWVMANYKASQAATKVMEMLNSPEWVDMVRSNMVMGYITMKSIIANPISNLIHKLYTGLYEDTLFSFVDVLYSVGDKRSFKERFQALFNIKPTKAYFSAFGPSAKNAAMIMLEGSPSKSEIDKYATYHQMRPLDAWIRLREDYVNSPTAMAKFNKTAKNIFEGVFGIPTAFFSRLLSAGDVLFSTPEGVKTAQKWANELNVPLDVFLTDPDYAEYADFAMYYGKGVTFQQENPVSSFIGKRIPDQESRQWKKWAYTLFATPVVPFFSTPVNIQYEILTMLPTVAFAEAARHGTAAQSLKISDEKRKFHAEMSKKMMRRAIGSIPLYAAMSFMLASGILSFVGGGEDEPETPEERQNKQMIEGRGGRLKFKGVDETIDGLKFGPLLTYLYIIDNINKSYKQTGGDIGAATIRGVKTITKSTIENTYMQGLKNVIDAVSSLTGEKSDAKKFESMLVDTYGSAFANILFPSILAQYTQMQDSEKALRLMDDDKFTKHLYNKAIRNRLGFIKTEGISIEKLPLRYNVLGEKMRTDIDEKNALYHYLFDFTRAQAYEPEKHKYVYALKKFKDTDDSNWLFDIAPSNITYNGESVKLTPEIRNTFQRVLGENVRKRYDDEMKELTRTKSDLSLYSFKIIKENAMKDAKEYILKMYKMEIENIYKEKQDSKNIVRSNKYFLD